MSSSIGRASTEDNAEAHRSETNRCYSPSGLYSQKRAYMAIHPPFLNF